ncbi:MAG: Lar family restriction alleviation protein [Lachnospiraceae bacterium]|nr:Lar family restriction alleviation protein [Lachnospiraceae bacterium]
MENGLKNCPFCGSADIHIIDRIDCSDGLHTYYHARCKECGVSTNEYSSQFDAIVAWNRRAEDN